MKNIILQAIFIVCPLFLVGFVTLPLTNKLANNDLFLQNCYLAVLRLMWTVFILAFSEKRFNGYFK